jgi:hypothetical protein
MSEFVRNTGTEQKVKKEASITPDYLFSEDKRQELSEKLLRTQRGYDLLHPKNKDLIVPSMRGKKMPTSSLEDWIPATHLLLGDRDFPYPEERKSTREKLAVSKYSVIGIALHQLSDLTGLINHGKFEEKSILAAFPTYSRKSLLPYIDALSDSKGLSLFDIWDKFRTHPGHMNLIKDEKAWIINEFPEIELSRELQEELAIRKGPEVYEAGCKLIPHLLVEDTEEDVNTYYESGVITNWDTLSPDGNTRLQAVQRNDCVYSYVDENGIQVIKIVDIKTGKVQRDYTHLFQASFMHFDDGHFVDNVMKKGLCPRRKEKKKEREKDRNPWYTPRTIDYIAPWHSNYSLDYIHFDIKTGEVKIIPVDTNYRDENGRRFLKWVAFYSDAFNALREQIEYYLQTGEVLDVFPKRIFTQNELPMTSGVVVDFSNLPSARPKPEKKIEQYFRIGNTVDSKDFACPHCGSPATETYVKEVKSHFKGVTNSFLYVRYTCKTNENHTNYLEDNRKVVLSAAILPEE